MPEDATYTQLELKEVRESIEHVDPYRNAMVFGQAIGDLSQRHNKLHLQVIEQLLRQYDSPTYLLARTFEGSLTPGLTTGLPHSGARRYPYFLWICVNGKPEADKTLEELGLTYEENFQRLPDTGFLIPRNAGITAAIKRRSNRM